MADRVAHVSRQLALVHGGYLARLGLLEVKVWLVLHSFSDFESGRVAVPMSVIARLAGIGNLQRAREAIHALEQQGIVALIREGGGKGDVTVRAVLTPKALDPLPWDRAETGTVSGPVRVGDVRVLNGDAGGAKQGRSAALNRAGQRLLTGPVGGPLFTNTSLNTPPPPAPTGTKSGPVTTLPAWVGKEEEEDFLKLVKRGIWEDSAQAILRGVPTAERERLWKAVVNDRTARDKGKCFFRRLRRFLESHASHLKPSNEQE